MAENLHLADLWVAVVPDTSKVVPAVDEAGKKAKTSFSQSVRGIGDALHDEISKGTAKATSGLTGVGGKIKDIFHKTGIDSGKALSDGFHFSAKDLGGSLDSAKRSMDSLGGVAKKTGVDISGASDALGKMRGKFDELRNATASEGNKLAGFAGQIRDAGKQAEGFGGKIGDLGGKVSLFAGRAQTLIGVMEQLDDPKLWNIPGIHQLGTAFDWLEQKGRDLGSSLHLPDLSHWSGFQALSRGGGPTATTDASGNPLFKSGTVTPGSDTPIAPPQYPSNMQGPIPLGATRGGAPITPKTPNFYNDWYSPSGSDWDGTAQGESGGKWDTNTGNGFYGGLQFTQSSWEEAGGLVFAPRADLATSKQQKMVAEKLFKMQGPGAWPNTYKRLPGGGGGGGGGGVGSIGSAGTNLGDVYTGPHTDDTHGLLVPRAASLKGLLGQMFGVTDIGGYRKPDGYNEHSSGEALDIMVGANKALGNQINQFLQQNASALGLQYSLWQQQEWDPGQGPKPMADRGSPTENHMDHVHARLKPGAFRGYRNLNTDGGDQNSPIGSEHDPVYVTNTGPGGSSGGSPFESQGQQLGQGLLSGLMQSIGLDGSVFGGKSPLDWGAVKLGGGLLNWGLGTARSMGGGPMGTPGGGGGGGGGGGLLGGLAGLIPQPGPMVSAAAGPGGGSLGVNAAMGGGGPVNIHHDQSINVTANGADPYAFLQPTQIARNAQRDPPRSNSTLSGVPQ